MMKYILILTCYTICLLLLSGCNKTQPSYFPLQKNMQWSYKVTKTVRDKIEKQKYVFVNLRNDILNNKPVFIRRSIDGTLLYYRKTDKGLKFLGIQNRAGAFIRNEQYIFHYPLEKNASWKETTTSRLLHQIVPPIKKRSEFRTEVPISAVIVSIDATATVGAGTYSNCMKIVRQGSKPVVIKNYKGFVVGNTVVKVHETSWYALGIGLVKFIRKETTDSHTLNQGDIIMELESFNA